MSVIDYSEKWGKDIDEAVGLALTDLKCSRDQVRITVLEEPSKGFLGFGAKLAKVRVELLDKAELAGINAEENKQAAKNVDSAEKAESEKPAAEPVPEVVPASVLSHAVQLSKENDFRNKNKIQINKKKAPVKEEGVISVKPASSVSVDSPVSVKVEEKPEVQDNAAQDSERKHTKDRSSTITKYSLIKDDPEAIKVTDGNAIEFLKNIFEKMELNLNIEGYEKGNLLYISIEGKDSGTIIGKRGATLESIQYLTSLVANKNSEKYMKVIVNAENYREKREQTLEKLALRLGDSVVKKGRSVRLEPMSPYERKVIHSALQNSPYVTTRSEGEEPHRRVVIELKKK